VLSALRSSVTGLSARDAAERLVTLGPNTLPAAARTSAWRMLRDQFASLIVWVLIVAGGISAALGDVGDSLAILAIVVLNAAIGFYQQRSAEQAIAALRTMAAPMGTVRRDGRAIAIPASEIVEGDVLALEAGDLVSADARLLTCASLSCIESALTGESAPSAKQAEALDRADVPLAERANMVFTGTSVATGTADAVVIATGMRTELGRIAGLLVDAGGDNETPLQRRLDSFGRVLVWAALGIVGLLFALGLLRGTPLLELFMTSVGLAVAAVPEGLPAVVTVALSLGVLRMARRRALVRKLAAVETLGSTSVICTDKTGTLTVGEMTVRALYTGGLRYDVTGDGYAPVGVITADGTPVAPAAPALSELAAVLAGCNRAQVAQKEGAWAASGDPTEAAMLVTSIKAGADRAQIDRDWPLVHEFPFDSDRKRSSVVRRSADGRLRVLANGAPGPLIERCTRLWTPDGDRPLTPDDRTAVLAVTSEMATAALRVIASARRDLEPAPGEVTMEQVEQDLVFVGLTGMHDPPRSEAAPAVARCRAAGIRVVMITGDHPETATTIARRIGIAADDDVAVTGVSLDAWSDADFNAQVARTTLYARVTAEHKLRIVRAWRAAGAVVAMTGDGVNDAPAIRGADIGIAMGRSGTEVARQAADMILTDDNFATIVAAVEEGRGIYDNIRKTLQYLLAGNTGELLLMTTAVIVGLPMPLLPIHLLWVNLVTDGLPALCLATDPVDADVMTRPPRPASERIASPAFLLTMGLTGVLTAAVAMGTYAWFLQAATVDTARSAAFTVLVAAELLRSFGARSATRAVWRIPLRTNLPLVAVVAASLAFQWIVLHNAALGRILRAAPLSFIECTALLAVAAVPLAGIEIVKSWRRARP
jgi:Ca2+-transporting ATPase